jgi:hypothetical protein
MGAITADAEHGLGRPPLDYIRFDSRRTMQDVNSDLPVCFGLLMSEIGLLTTIICPMPFAMRKR